MTRLFVTVGLRYLSFDALRLGSQISHSHYCPLLGSFNSITFIKTRYYASNKDTPPESQIATMDAFSATIDKNKGSYLDLLHFYKNKDKHRRGNVEFIYAALKHMKDFGVHRDLEAYKALIDVMPKGKYVALNIIQAEFQHFPKQQQCIIDLLEEMEVNRVCPDREMEDMLRNIFGKVSHPMKRYWRMMYWMPKMKNISPWPVPDPAPTDSIELAKLAIKRITSVDPSTEISVLQTKDVEHSIDDTWIVNGQSRSQRELIERHNATKSLFVEGAFRLWLKYDSVNYFILRADPDPTPKPQMDPDDVSKMAVPMFDEMYKNKIARPETVHEQEDSTILAVCATGSSSRDSLLSWIRLLQKDNPRLGEISVLFTLKSPIGNTEPIKEIEGDVPVPAPVTDSEKQ